MHAKRKYNKFVLTPITPPCTKGMKHGQTILINATPGRIYRGDDADAHDSTLLFSMRVSAKRAR